MLYQGNKIYKGAVYQMTIQIKKCKLEDVHVLREISIETFQDTYSKQNKPENMLAYLDRAFPPQQLERELVNRGSQFYFIYFDEDAAGYLKVNTNH